MNEGTAIIYVEGKVQGVFFRVSTKTYADKLEKVTGIVKNLDDGRVYIEATGSITEVKKLIKWCENGPELAKVDSLKIEWLDKIKSFNGFEIMYY